MPDTEFKSQHCVAGAMSPTLSRRADWVMGTLRALIAVSVLISAVLVGPNGRMRDAAALGKVTACAETGGLAAGEAVASPSGRYQLKLQRNGNLVLYDYLGTSEPDSSDDISGLLAAPRALWSSNSSGISRPRLVMGSDGDLVLHGRTRERTQLVWHSRTEDSASLVLAAQHDESTQLVWHSRTEGNPGALLQVCDEGTVRVRLPGGRVLWTAGTSTPTAGPLGQRHVVFDRTAQRVWLIAADGRLFDTYPVSGRLRTPGIGRYSVFSKSPNTTSFTGTSTMKHMVRFTYGPNGYAIGFHSIPRSFDGQPLQSLDQLGEAHGAGCVRQQDSKARQLYDWVPVGTPIIVVG